MAPAAATVVREGETLVFSGRIERAQVPSLWRDLRAAAAAPVRRVDLAAVGSVDSAGIALLAELAARHPGLQVDGDPQGLAELRTAYRLSPALAIA